MTGVLQLHACRAPSRTPHAGFVTLRTNSVWISGTSARCVKIGNFIRKQSGTRAVCSTYSSSFRHRTDRLLLGNCRQQALHAQHRVTSSHLPIYPIEYFCLVFPWYPVRDKAPQFKDYLLIRPFPDLAFLPLVRQSCLRSHIGIDRKSVV